MRVNFQTMQVGSSELCTTFIGDAEGLKSLAEGLIRAVDAGVARVVFKNDNSSLQHHLLMSCVDAVEPPKVLN